MSVLHPLHHPAAKRSKGQTDPRAPPLAVFFVVILEQALSIPVMHFLKDSMWSRGLHSFWISASGGQEILEQGRCPTVPLRAQSPYLGFLFIIKDDVLGPRGRRRKRSVIRQFWVALHNPCSRHQWRGQEDSPTGEWHCHLGLLFPNGPPNPAGTEGVWVFSCYP